MRVLSGHHPLEVRMITAALQHASILAIVSMFMGVVPLATAVVYAVWPSEQKLMLMRPLSLATIFAAVSGTALGFINVFMNMGTSVPPRFSHVSTIGIAESLVPLFFGFGCLTVSWLCVALGLWRKP
jgi:hypothetical protein